MRATRVGDCTKRTSAVLTWASLLVIIAAVHPAWCAEKSTEKVRIAVSSKSLGFLDVWAARERGFYRKHGIEAEIIAMRPPLTIGAIQAGEIDYAFGASSISRGSMSGAPVRIVSLSLRTSFHTLVARSGIKSIAEMKGKTIAVTIGAADDFVARLLVRRAGLDVRDVSFVIWADQTRVFPRSRPGESMRLRFHCPSL